jgi:ABC-2 type transport system permease protein
VLAAKAAITGTAMLIAGEAVSLTSFFIVQGVLHTKHLSVSFSHPGVPGAVLANGTLLLVCSLFAVAMGAIVRHTAGGIAATIALITVPSILGLLGDPWGTRIGRFTLIDAAQQVSYLHPQTDLLSPAWSLLVLFAWPAAAPDGRRDHDHPHPGLTGRAAARYRLVCDYWMSSPASGDSWFPDASAAMRSPWRLRYWP